MFKMDCPKNTSRLWRMRDKKWGNKTQVRKEKNQLLLKMWEKNEHIIGVALEKQQQKPTCVVCVSRKSTFKTREINKINKKQATFFADCKNKCWLIVQGINNILIIYVQKTNHDDN